MTTAKLITTLFLESQFWNRSRTEVGRVTTGGGGGGAGRNGSGTHEALARVSRSVSAIWSTCLLTSSAMVPEYFWTVESDESWASMGVSHDVK